jgi:hypothetical protein
MVLHTDTVIIVLNSLKSRGKIINGKFYYIDEKSEHSQNDAGTNSVVWYLEFFNELR